MNDKELHKESINSNISFEGNIPMQAAIDIVLKTRTSICVQGGAGTGKSTFIKHLKKTLSNNRTLFVAPTGIAARNIGGYTIHSTFGINPSTFFPNEDLRKANISIDMCNDISSATRVFVDEISMVHSGIMECIDYVLRRYGNSDRPFGGKQMIFVGDPFQLPPIVNTSEVRRKLIESYGGLHFFQSPAYRELDPLSVILKDNYRQKEGDFIDCLNNIRLGINSEETLKTINVKCLK